ncbi:MAG: glycosyltransferase family 4 protein [Deltaproteobacteria bacterium]|nr:MAG: glycosyltransferase family 4 protein [Deltaproteobacteria bacterium]
MRIALVHMRHAGTGGTERYLNHLAAHLAEAGHEVCIVCRRHEAPPHPAVRFVVLRGPALTRAGRMWTFAKAVERHVRRTPYDVVYGLGKTWSHDVVRLGGGCHATYLERAHAATLRPHERLLRGGAWKQRLALVIERRAVTRAAHVIVNSGMVKRDVMQRYAIPGERIAVIPNGVDLARFRPDPERGAALRRACGFGPEHAVVLFLGTGYGRKGLDRVLDAFAALLHPRPQARLLVVGYDSAAARFERQAKRLGVQAAVRFLGGRRDAEGCYAAADLYVLPTRYDPFANTTLEALAAGVPVITSDANGAAELISTGVEGAVLPEPISAGALCDALVDFLDPERAKARSEAARRLAERHSIERCMEASAQVLAEIASLRGASTA